MKKVVLLMIFIIAPAYAADNDLSTLLMKATFRISGTNSQGTCFIIGRLFSNNNTRAKYVLVTADHVLSGIKGDTASIALRQKVMDDYIKLPHVIRIRNNQQQLWLKHPETDVAVMYVRLPQNAEVVLLTTKFLVSDDKLKELEIRPGDDLLALGFPLGQESNAAGFPILRSGIIAGYPILPTKKTKTMLFDFEVFKGNSGGPVFMIAKNRAYGGSLHLGMEQFITGLVSQERTITLTTQTPFEATVQQHPLKLGVIIHASLIKEAIEMLPEPNEAQQTN